MDLMNDKLGDTLMFCGWLEKMVLLYNGIFRLLVSTWTAITLYITVINDICSDPTGHL